MKVYRTAVASLGFICSTNSKLKNANGTVASSIQSISSNKSRGLPYIKLLSIKAWNRFISRARCITLRKKHTLPSVKRKDLVVIDSRSESHTRNLLQQLEVPRGMRALNGYLFVKGTFQQPALILLSVFLSIFTFVKLFCFVNLSSKIILREYHTDLIIVGA